MTRVLALDVGSSSARARGYDERAEHVAGMGAQRSYRSSDADELLGMVLDTLEPAGRVDAVASSCFWHSLLAVDSTGRPLTPVLTWRDLRAASEAEELAASLDDVQARTGAPLHPSFWPAKLLWLRRTQADVFARASRFVSFADYVWLRLFGAPRTSLSMASGTGLLDLRTCAWDEPLLDALGLDPARLAEISDEPEERDGAPWFPALGDGACSNLGAGCVTRDRAALMIGTSGALRTIHEDADAPLRPGLFRYRLDERRFVEGGSLSDGGSLHDWLERTLRVPDDASVVDRPPGGHGLTFLALLGGERSPGWSAHARGAVAGLTFATEPIDLMQAALEGVAFRFADVLELMPEIRELVATGGALARNPDWVQVIADVLERPLVRSAVDEASARGAAVVALERLGVVPPQAPPGETVEPRPERAETYRAARERQRRLYRALA
jgi:gluconokinase